MSEHAETRVGLLAAALDEFLHCSPDVEAAAVVSFDGLPMASALPDDLDEDRVGAMSAALLSLGEQAALGLGRGQLNQVFIEGEHGFVFLMSARDQAVLAAVAGRSTKLGFLLFEMRRAADRVGQVLEGAGMPAPWRDADDADLAPSADVVALLGGEAPTPAEMAPSPLPRPSVVSSVSASPSPAVPPPGAPLVAVPEASPWESPVPTQSPAPHPGSTVETPAAQHDHDVDLLAVLASEPLTNREVDVRPEPAPFDAPREDRDLLTEALFEMRRASGDGDDAAWSAPQASGNGWG